MGEIDDCALLMNAFPAVFAQAPFIIGPGADVLSAPLMGYFHTSGAGKPATDVHGHCISPKEVVPVIHSHKGGRRAHFHEEGDTNGNPSSQ